MDDYFQNLSDLEQSKFGTILNFATQLGYKAKKDKTKSIGYTFFHPKVKKTILRFSMDKGKPILKMKFFASRDYSPIFKRAIQAVIEEYDYRYTGCYGCYNHCNSTEGYRYKYPDGREYYRCGTELIDIVDIENVPIQEILDLLKKQHEFYLSKVGEV